MGTLGQSRADRWERGSVGTCRRSAACECRSLVIDADQQAEAARTPSVNSVIGRGLNALVSRVATSLATPSATTQGKNAPKPSWTAGGIG